MQISVPREIIDIKAITRLPTCRTRLSASSHYGCWPVPDSHRTSVSYPFSLFQLSEDTSYLLLHHSIQLTQKQAFFGLPFPSFAISPNFLPHSLLLSCAPHTLDSCSTKTTCALSCTKGKDKSTYNEMQISMCTWCTRVSAASQGASVVITEISHGDISYITRRENPPDYRRIFGCILLGISLAMFPCWFYCVPPIAFRLPSGC